MTKSAYQKIQSLHQRIARLEHQARHRDIVTRKGRKSLSQLWDLAEEFNSLAQNKGFLRSKITEKNDLPVVVLERNMFVFFEPLGYHFEANGSTRKYMDWGNLVNRLNMEQGGFGNEEELMNY